MPQIDWSIYDALEMSRVVDDGRIIKRLESDQNPDGHIFYTIYGHIPNNGVEALFDMKEALSKVNEIFVEHDNLETIYNYI